jgi:hypothetical protein
VILRPAKIYESRTLELPQFDSLSSRIAGVGKVRPVSVGVRVVIVPLPHAESASRHLKEVARRVTGHAYLVGRHAFAQPAAKKRQWRLLSSPTQLTLVKGCDLWMLGQRVNPQCDASLLKTRRDMQGLGQQRQLASKLLGSER